MKIPRAPLLALITRWLAVAGALLNAVMAPLFILQMLGTVPLLPNETMIPAWPDHPEIEAILGGVMLALTAYGLYRLARLMRLYERGDLFDATAAGHLRSFALCLFARQLINSALSLLAGDAIAGPGLWPMFLSLVLLLLAGVIADAHAVKRENDRYI
jgi:hypothetical protein